MVTDLGRTAIVILTWNTKHFLDEFFRHLVNQTYKNFDLIAVDSGSKDGSMDYIKRKWANKLPNKVFYIQLGKNIGFAAGHNAGIYYAVRSGQYQNIAIINTDTKPGPTWLEELIRTLNSQKDIGIATSKILLYHKYRIFSVSCNSSPVIKKITSDTDYFPILYSKKTRNIKNFLTAAMRFDLNYFKPFKEEIKNEFGYEPHKIHAKNNKAKSKDFLIAVPFKKDPSQIKIDLDRHCNISIKMKQTKIAQNYGGYYDAKTATYKDRGFLIPESFVTTVKYPEAACGCAMAIKVSAIKNLGAFEPKLFSYFEDCELSLRYRRANLKTKFAARSAIEHYFWGSTTTRLNPEGIYIRTFYGMRNRMAIIKKYYGTAKYLYTFLRSTGRIILQIPMIFTNKEVLHEVRANISALIASLPFSI